MKLKWYLLFVITIGTVVSVFAQSNISIDHRTVDYGKYFRWVYDITQDDNGFIWMANHTGLRRYDGTEFITYQHDATNKNSLSNNTIRKVAADAENHIWAYSEDRVFNRLSLKNGKIVRISKFLNNGVDIKQVAPNLVHFTTLKNGLFVILLKQKEIDTNKFRYSFWRFSKEHQGFIHLVDVPTESTDINTFTESKNGNLWMWDLNNGYYQIDISKTSYKFHPIFENGTKSLNDVSGPIDNERRFWYPPMHQNSNLKSSELQSFPIPEEINMDRIQRIQVDNFANIWFYDETNSLYQFNTETLSLDHFEDPMFNSSNEVQLMSNIYVDKDGGYWNGHYMGAVRFSKKKELFDTYFSASDFQASGHDYQSFGGKDILEKSKNKLLVKNNEEAIYILDLSSKNFEEVSLGLGTVSKEKSGNKIYGMVMGSDGFLWFIHKNKIVKSDLNKNSSEFFDIDQIKIKEDQNGHILEKNWPALFEDSNGMLWWCDELGIYQFDKKTKKMSQIQVQTPPSIAKADFRNASYDRNTNSIYAYFPRGIYRIDCTSKSVQLLELFSAREGYDTLITGVIYWKNNYWVSTNKGVFSFDPKTKQKKRYSIREGLPSAVVFSLLAAENHLWLATQNGLCQFDPKTGKTVTYNEDYGLPSNSFNLRSYAQTLDGRMFFGGPNGLIGFQPEEFDLAPKKLGKLNWVEVLKYNQENETLSSSKNVSYQKMDKLIVPAKERTISFKYMLSNFDDENKNQYAHFMEGLEKDWIYDKLKNEVAYLQIPPGNYTFRARATDSFGNLASNELVLPLIVKEYWYLQNWALVTYVLMSLFIIGIVNRFILQRKLAVQEAKRIRELDDVKTRMYTNITHEFRTPLTVLLGMNDAIKGYAKEDNIESLFKANEMIDRNGKNLLNLVNQMLELSKLESGQLVINNQQGNIINYIKYRLESFQSYAAEKSIQINLHTSNDSIIMDFDIDKLSHILRNLISNAIKFSLEEGIIDVYLSELVGPNKEAIFELKVRDNGIGMNEDQVTHIFDRFYQVDSSITRKGEGTGIGLSLVKELIKLLNGTIEVHSKINEGSEFVVRLPMTNDSEFMQGIKAPISEEWIEDSRNMVLETDPEIDDDQSRPLVLIVEDNVDVSHYIKISLSEEYRVISAENGIDGKDLAISHVPDIIISDVMMPIMDGFELCETIKKDERTSHIPFILLTGKADIDSKIEGLTHGADVYLAKPFNRQELLIRIKNLLTLRSEIQKRFSGSDLSKAISQLPQNENSFLVKARNYILDDIENEDFNIKELCSLMHMSRAQLHRKLVAITGESTSILIRKVRLEKSQELLSNHEFNISEVAFAIGFKTQAHFSRVFSENFGCTPSEYKNKMEK